MNSQANAAAEGNERESANSAMATTLVRITHPFYWSVRRELWEHRSLYLAPFGIAGAVVLGFLVALARLPQTMRTLSLLGPAAQRGALAQPYDVAAGMIMGAAFIVSIFYSADALYGERRDRSILFWKSLPVSDLTTVLAKASIPLVVLPILAFATTVATQAIMLLLSAMVLLAHGLSVATLWTQLQLPTILLMLLYHLVTAHMLWYAPFYAWLLLISAWARRAPFLWAVLPPLAIGIFEKIAFHSANFASLLNDRFSGSSDAASSMMGDMPFHPGMRLDPVAFLTAPGLWLGLVFAALFLVTAARVRRYREPS